MKGFSLIELIISVTVIMLFAGMGVTYYNQFTEQKKLEQETKKIVDTLELAKTKTNTGDTSLCQGDGFITPVVERYTVAINPTSYQIAPTCSMGTSTLINYQVDKNINITPSADSINFNPLTTQITPACILIKNTSFDKCTYIKVESSGLISDGKCVDCISCACP